MKTAIVFALLLAFVLSITTIQINKVKKDPKEKLLQQYGENDMDNNLQYLLNKFVPQAQKFKLGKKKPKTEVGITNYESSQYYGEISIGNPPQKFKALFETGSADLTVLSSKCYTLYCQVHKRYYSNKSTTFQTIGDQVLINTGQDYKKGYWSLDNIHIGGQTIEEVPLIQFTNLQDDLLSKHDVVFGLAWTRLSLGRQPPFKYGYDQGLWKNSFSMMLTHESSKPGSVLVLGGVDKKYAASEFNYYPSADDSRWTLRCYGMKVGSNFLETDFVSLNSEIQGIIGTRALVKDIKHSLGIHYDTTTLGCEFADSLPDISFKFGQDYLTLENKFYIIRDGLTCTFGIYPGYPSVILGRRALMIGDIFLTKYYTHYDFKKSRIGFAIAKANQ